MTKGGQQTELVLETKHLLGVFFAIVAICGVFFALGYVVGRNTFTADENPEEEIAVVAAADDKPSPMPPATYLNRPKEESTEPGDPQAGEENLSFYESAEAAPQAKMEAPVTTNESAEGAQSTKPEAKKLPEVAASQPPTARILVQVSALSQKEDAEALVQLLKKRNLPVFVASDTKAPFFRVMIGPYQDEKEAEKVRKDLEGDGFRPFIRR